MNMTTSSLICPVCGRPLQQDSREAFCENNHHFDRAKQGYLNLLSSRGSGLSHHGDDRLMLTERRNFLEKGHYAPMRQAAAEIAVASIKDQISGDIRSVKENLSGMSESDHDDGDSTGIRPHSPTVLLDCGCGEGYYSHFFYSQLKSAGLNPSMLCLDISREAAKMTAKLEFPHETVVASAYELPVLSGSCHLITDLFAPLAEKEFYRVLVPGGLLLRVVPEEKHLWELKQAVYDQPYENPPVDPELDGFELIRRESVRYTIRLNDSEDIQSLFKMTPYYYKTSRADQSKLENLRELTTQLSFAILVNRKPVNREI